MRKSKILIGIAIIVMMISFVYAQTPEQKGETIGKDIVNAIGAGFSAVGSAFDAIGQKVDQDPTLSRNKDKVLGLVSQKTRVLRTVQDADDENVALKKLTEDLSNSLAGKKLEQAIIAPGSSVVEAIKQFKESLKDIRK